MIGLESTGSLHGELISDLILTIDEPHILTSPYTAGGERVDAVVATGPHTDYPGIIVYDLFDATTMHGARRILSLEEAIADRRRSKRFLVSEKSGRAIISSQIGYPNSSRFELGDIDVEGFALELDMHDFARILPHHSLTTEHLLRVDKYIPDSALYHLPQERADQIFRFLTKAASQNAR